MLKRRVYDTVDAAFFLPERDKKVVINLKAINKWISAALILAVLASCLCSAAFANGDSDFIVTDGVLTGYTGSGGDVVIPDDMGITEIGEGAFQDCISLTSVTLPDGLQAIGVQAFSECISLESIVIPDGVVSIGAFAFSNCSALTAITIPASVVSIGDKAFFKFYWYTNVITICGVPGSYAEAYARQYAMPFEATAEITVVPTQATVTVDGMPVGFEAYNICGYNYFKLRDIAMVLNGTEKQFEVGWEAAKNAVLITAGMRYTPVGGELTYSEAASDAPAAFPPSEVYLDGNLIMLSAYNIGGNNYFKLRDIAETLDFGVTWDDETRTVGLDTTTGYGAE